MRLLLRKPVETLGEPGDEVNVRAGYARNFLLPRGIALPITEENRREVAEARKAWAVQRVEELEAAKALAGQLEGRVLRFERRVKTDTDELYGSVSVLDLSRSLEEQGFTLARNRIILGGPIRRLGESSVTIRVHPEVQVVLAVEVTALAVESLGDRAEVLTPPTAEAPAATADSPHESADGTGDETAAGSPAAESRESAAAEDPAAAEAPAVAETPAGAQTPAGAETSPLAE